MNNKKNKVSLVIGVVVFIGLLFGFKNSNKVEAEQSNNIQGAVNINLTFSEVKELIGMFGKISSENQYEGNLGALSSPDVYSYLNVWDTFTAKKSAYFLEDVGFDTDTFFVDVSTDRNGIGTTTPLATLHIVGNGAGEDSFRVASSTTNLFSIDSNNDLNFFSGLLFGDSSATRIGINDNTPSYTLDVNGTTQFLGASIFGNSLTAILGSSTLATTTVESLTTGGQNCSLTDSTGGTYTLTQEEMARCSMFEFASGGAGQEVIALTFPATSSMTTLIPNSGDCRTWTYDASALAVATTTTMTAGTGHNIIAYTTDDDVIDGAEFAQIQMCRKTNTDVNTIVSELLNAD